MRSRYVSYVLLSEKKLFLCLKKTKKILCFVGLCKKNAIFAVILLL